MGRNDFWDWFGKPLMIVFWVVAVWVLYIALFAAIWLYHLVGELFRSGGQK